MGYSEQFRIELLDIYFSSNMSLRKFSQEYGLSKNTLYSWAKDDSRYVVVKKKAAWSQYSPDYKHKAVKMVLLKGLSSRKVAQIMGCSHGALVSGWVRSYKDKMIGLDAPKKPIGKKKPDTKKARASNTLSLEEYVLELEAQNERLTKDNVRLQFEADVARAIVEVRSKKVDGLDESALTNAEKTETIDLLRPKHLLKELTRYLHLSASSYEYRKQVENTKDKYEQERKQVVNAFLDSNGIYGYRRITAVANKEQGAKKISERIVRKIMRQEDLRAKQSKRCPYGSHKGTVGKVATNAMNRNFKADKPLQKVSTDVTEFKIGKQKVYLSPLIDLFAGEVVSYTHSLHPTVEFVMGMFDKPTKKKLRGTGCMAQSDQGFQYQHAAYQTVLKELGCIQSMSRKGNCIDDSPAESFFARLKVEFFHDTKFASVEDFREKLDQYIWWYNNKRIKMRLGGMSPVEYRIAYLRSVA